MIISAFEAKLTFQKNNANLTSKGIYDKYCHIIVDFDRQKHNYWNMHL
jgi:hypothetical protein